MSSSAGDGGQAYTGRADTELETGVNVSNISAVYGGAPSLEKIALIDRLFHEFGHSIASHFTLNTTFSLNDAVAQREILLTGATGPNQVNFETLDSTYSFGKNFLAFIADYARAHPTIVVDGRTISLANYQFTAADISTYYYGGNIGTDIVTGVMAGGAELYQNTYILSVSAKLKAQFDIITANLTRTAANQVALTDEPNAASLAYYDAAGWLDLRPVPAGYNAAVSGPWGSRLSHYTQTARTLADYNSDGKHKQFRGNSVVDIIVAAENWSIPEQAFRGLIGGLTVIDGGQLGLALGSAIGRRLTSNPFGQVIASGTLSTILGGIGEFIDREIFHGTPTTEILKNGIEGFGSAVFQNIKGAGIGALSSYLTAELLNALDIEGIPGEIAQSIGSAAVSKVLSNLLSFGDKIGQPILDAAGNQIVVNGVIQRYDLFAGVGTSMLVNAIGTYIGSKLAAEIKTFKSVGGQIGSQVGAIYAGFASSVALAAASGLAIGGASIGAIVNAATLFAAANPVVAIAIVAVVVLLNTLFGGFIGSLFGGTPRSGADATWDAAKDEFVVANIYSRKGGSKDAAKSLAGAAANSLNAVLYASGATLLDPSAVQTGNYGMRYSDYVYRPTST